MRIALEREVASAAVPPFTASFGVADHQQSTTAEGLVELADEAMFRAKAAGRNRVVIAEEATTTAVDPRPAPTGPSAEPETAQ